MTTLAEIRAQNPQYEDLTDLELADGLHSKFYADMPKEEFYKRIGFVADGGVDYPTETVDQLLGRQPDDWRKDMGIPRLSDRATEKPQDRLREIPNGPLNRIVGALGDYVDTAMLGGADEALASVYALPAFLQDTIGFRPQTAGIGRQPSAGAVFKQELSRLEQQRRDQGINSTQRKVATGVGLAASIPFGGEVSQFIAKAPTVMGRTIRAGEVGGAVGGTSGFLGTEGDLGDRTIGGGIGLAAGAALGGAAQPGMELLGFGARKGAETGRAILNTMKNQAQARANPSLQADKLIARALIQDGAYPRPAPLPGEGFVNTGGENLVALGRQATVAPGRGRAIAGDFFENQAAGAPDRAADSVRTMATRGYYGTVEELDTARRTAAGPLYEQAYALPAVEQWTPRIATLMQRPSMRAAFAKAQRIAAEEGRDPMELGLTFNEAGDPIFLAGARNGQIPSTQTMDYIKRGLDDVVENYRDGTTGRLNLDTEGRAINATRAELVGILRENNPTYARALDSWGGPSHALDILEFGRDVYARRGNPADAIRRFQAMSPEDQELARIGFVRDATADLGNVGDNGSVYLKLFGNNNKRAVAQAMFPNRQAFDRFAAQMQAERKMLAANRTIQGGSPTSRIDADKAAMSDAENNLGVLDALRQGSIPRLIAEALQRGKNMQQGISPDVAEELARRLFSMDPGSMQRALTAAQNVRVPAPLTALQPGWLRKNPLAMLLGQGAGLGGAAIATPQPKVAR